MSHLESKSRSRNARRALVLLQVCAIVATAGGAHAKEEFVYSGEPIHPGCIHALAMQQGDAGPVTTAVNLEGCASSERSKIVVRSGSRARTWPLIPSLNRQSKRTRARPMTRNRLNQIISRNRRRVGS